MRKIERRPAIVAYDIADDGRRRRIRATLREWRLDGQRSVCECRLTDGEADELFLQLGSIIDRRSDRLLLAWVHEQRPALARGRGRTDLLSTRLWVSCTASCRVGNRWCWT